MFVRIKQIWAELKCWFFHLDEETKKSFHDPFIEIYECKICGTKW